MENCLLGIENTQNFIIKRRTLQNAISIIKAIKHKMRRVLLNKVSIRHQSLDHIREAVTAVNTHEIRYGQKLQHYTDFQDSAHQIMLKINFEPIVVTKLTYNYWKTIPPHRIIHAYALLK